MMNFEIKKQSAKKHRWRPRTVGQKIGLWLAVFLTLWIGSMYGIAEWYIWQNRNKPVVYGTTFISGYAQYFNLEPKETLNALLQDLNIKHVRLVSYWDEIEAQKGVYDFSNLDWQVQMAEHYGAKVSLAIGMRQPRWPECHVPSWFASEPKEQWSAELKDFIGRVVDRYKDSPALESYQLENEFFLKAFGKCTDFDRTRLVDEFNLVKKQDPTHPIIISRSNNVIGLPARDPRPDMFGVAVYKRTWYKPFVYRYLEYPFPAWFYGFLAGAGKLLTGKDMIIHELQAEPWVPDGFDLNTAPISEQDKSLNAERLKDRLEYAKATGMKRIDLWGAEWWYARKVQGDPSIWNVVKDELQDVNKH